MSYTNIVLNNSPSLCGVVNAEGEGEGKMMYCIFQNNFLYLFSIYYAFEVSHSFIDHFLTYLGNPFHNSFGTNNSYTNRMTYQIDFFGSLHCITYMPPPSSTFGETMARTYDSECKISEFSSDGCLRKCRMNDNMKMFPIFISFVILIY